MMEVLIGIALIGLVGLIVVPVLFLKAYVLVKLWVWFLIPLGAIEIGYVDALGITLVANFIVAKSKPEHIKPENMKEALTEVATHFLASLVVLALGWVIVQFR
jgi:hypothetical protein